MSSKGGWGFFSKKKSGNSGVATTATDAEPVNQSSKNEPNDYATWSLGLWHLIQMRNNEKYKDSINNLKIAVDKDRGDITFGNWSEQMQIIKDVRDIKSADYLDYKLLDLGGGDQNKIRKTLPASASIQTGGGDSVEDIVKKFKANKGTLITGGSLEQRIETLKDFILNEKVNEHTYALLPEMETKLTALSYYDKAMEIIKTKNISKLCLLPIGSTDAHIIIYYSDGNVDTQTHENYKELPDDIKLKKCDHYVFAGSATYYVKKGPTDSNEKGVYYDRENKKSKDFKDLMDKLKLTSDGDSSDGDFSNYSIGGKGTEYVDMDSKAVEKCLEIASIKDGGKNKHTKKNKKIVMKSRRNKKAKRKTKSNKRSNRKNKSKRGRR